MTWQTEGIKCPWSVVAPLCTKVNPVICAHPIETVTLFKCTQMTLGIVIPAPKARTVAQDRTRKRTPEPFILRIEKFAVISDPKLVTLFDTVYAATREDKTSAEIMLDMYSDSLGGLMSRAILPSQPHWDENTGIKCPAIILRRLLGDYPPGLIPYDLPPVVDRAGVAISDVTDKHIIFRIGRPGKINSKKVGGNYVYDHDWEAVLIQRQRLLGSPSGLQLYDLVITNTKHWGEAAQIALEFIESTLE